MSRRRHTAEPALVAAAAILVTLLLLAGAAMIVRVNAQTGAALPTTDSAPTAPAVPCTDSDMGMDSTVKGTAKGIYTGAAAGYHAIFGLDPNPNTPQQTTDNYSTYIDHCSWDPMQLNEGFCDSNGKLSSYGFRCAYGCSDGVCTSATDNSPVVSLSVQTANPSVTGFRPGVRAYYSTTITDDKGLKSVLVTTSPMMYSSAENRLSQCEGKTSCEEKVYIIVPANPGAQFVTVTATDTADHTSTKTVPFEAAACTTDADCGGGSIQWAGATYCGSEDGTSETDIMQYGVAGICKAGGICDTSSLPRVKQECPTGQVCTYDTNGTNFCIAPPPACTLNAQVTSVCTCGKSAYNYPGDWRVRSATYCCSDGRGSTYTTSPGPCFAATPSSPLPLLPSAPSPLPASATGSAAASAPSSPSPTSPSPSHPSPGSPSAPSTLPPVSSANISSPPVSTPPHGSSTAEFPGPLSAVAEQASPIPASKPAPSLIQTFLQKLFGTQQGPTTMKRKVRLMEKKIVEVEKSLTRLEGQIAALENKIDKKLQFLEVARDDAVRRRIESQVDRWLGKAQKLEEKREALEGELDQLHAAAEEVKM